FRLTWNDTLRTKRRAFGRLDFAGAAWSRRSLLQPLTLRGLAGIFGCWRRFTRPLPIESEYQRDIASHGDERVRDMPIFLAGWDARNLFKGIEVWQVGTYLHVFAGRLGSSSGYLWR